MPTHVILSSSDSSYQGELSIKKDKEWILTLKELFTADVYKIKGFKKSQEAEMVYYYFELTKTDGAKVTLMVNFRNNPDNPQSSVFNFKEVTDGETRTFEFISKELSREFTRQISKDYD
jgi:hypothetical protein